MHVYIQLIILVPSIVSSCKTSLRTLNNRQSLTTPQGIIIILILSGRLVHIILNQKVARDNFGNGHQWSPSAPETQRITQVFERVNCLIGRQDTVLMQRSISFMRTVIIGNDTWMVCGTVLLWRQTFGAECKTKRSDHRSQKTSEKMSWALLRICILWHVSLRPCPTRTTAAAA